MSGKGRLLPAAFKAASVRYRRVSPVSVRPGERPLTERTAGVQPARLEQVFMRQADLAA
jgi:hypothetical protein